MSCIHYNIKVTGKVQGVWFRKYTMEKALALGLKGFVKNEPDGSVYIEAESHQSDILDLFTNWLYEGSPLSKVEKVIIDREMSCKNYQNFTIKDRG